MNKNGFTLTELMIVIIIISGLMYLIVPNITSTKKALDDKTCDAYIELVNSQIQAYKLEYDDIPLTLTDLVNGNYIKSEKCPNGNVINYVDGVATKGIYES